MQEIEVLLGVHFLTEVLAGKSWEPKDEKETALHRDEEKSHHAEGTLVCLLTTSGSPLPRIAILCSYVRWGLVINSNL